MKKTVTLIFAFAIICRSLSAQSLLWGMTHAGGASDIGAIFNYDPATNTYTKTFDFTNSSGYSPKGSLTLASNGRLYGTTSLGGTNSYGTLFEYNPSNLTYTVKVEFSDTVSGSYPTSSLVEFTDGKLYGTTDAGGSNGDGILFQYDPATSTFTKKFNFDLNNHGGTPQGKMVVANGKLYGLTKTGGAHGSGIIYEYDPTTNVLTDVVDFGVSASDCDDPTGGLILATNGILYGLTYSGGTHSVGTLFQFDPLTNTSTKKFDFDGGTHGSYPDGDLIQATNGKLYGLTSMGGANFLGSLFEYDITANTLTREISFDASTTGNTPMGSLVQASNGKLYGLNSQAGSSLSVYGTLFEYDITSSALTHIRNFGGAEGRYPWYNQMVELSGSSGVAGFENNEGIAIAPNPFNYSTTISFEQEQQNTTIRIMDVVGKEIKTVNFIGKQLIIDKGEMKAGIYFVQITDKKKNVVNSKIVVE